ncbi:MAG: hypothetical protein Q9221_007651 [Calogaya cf. arnoldii]
MANSRSSGSGSETSGTNANKTFERTLKSLDSASSEPFHASLIRTELTNTVPPEFQNDFEDCVSSDDHGSSTHRDNKVGRSSDLSRSVSDDSPSIDDSDGEYQPEHVNTYQHRGLHHTYQHHGLDPLDPQVIDARCPLHQGGVSLRDIEIDEDHDDSPEDQEEVDVDVDMEDVDPEDEDPEDEDGKSAKKRGQARGKKLTAKPVGVVRYHDGELEWFDANYKVWRPAVYHQDIREDLIKDAARWGRYRYRLARGKDKLDVTAFHPAYAENGPDRDNWPKILFQYAPTVADFMHTKPPLWQTHDGRVVIDCNNDAMKAYPEIPATLARNADTWLMLTCMRLNNHIAIQVSSFSNSPPTPTQGPRDFRGRMPGDRKMSMADPLGRNRISMNMTRFRKFGCCLTWNSIRNVDTQRQYLDKKLPRRCIRLNSTESFRKLFAWEVAESELQDAGKFLKRTRSRQKDTSRARSHSVYNRKLAEFKQLKRTFDRQKLYDLDADYDTEDKEFAREHSSAQPDDGAEDAIKIEADSAELQLVKPGRRRRSAKASSSSKDVGVLVLPGESSPGSDHQENKTRPMCPRKHNEYAGFLSRAPNTVREAQLLYDLLRPTRVHYEKNTGMVAPETYADECYKCQLADLQNAMIDWHEAHRQFNKLAPAKLIGLQYVENGELYWNTNWVDTWFGHQPVVNPDDIF